MMEGGYNTGPSKFRHQSLCVHFLSVLILSAVPIDQVLQLLHGFWFAVSATGQYLPAVIYPDDTVRRVYEETTTYRRA